MRRLLVSIFIFGFLFLLLVSISTYTYGATGNLLTSPAGVYSYDGFSGGVFVNPHAATQVGNRALGYDPNGNLTSDTGGTASIANSWNYRNELTSTTITGGGQTSVNYGYDVKGQRISLREQTGSAVTSTDFPTPAYSKTTRPDGSTERMVSIEAAGLPIATIRTRNTDAPELYITHTDHLRSTRLVTTKGAGLGNVNIVEETDYDPFGKITRHEQTGDFAEKKKFTSHEFDSATNYTYAKARYLDTNAGRFISQDKAFLELGSPQLSESFEKSAFAGQYIANRLRGVDDTRAALETILKDPQALNSYAYVRNNPVKFVDETGELYNLVIGAGLGFVGGVATQYFSDVRAGLAAGQGWGAAVNFSSAAEYGVSAIQGAATGFAVASGGILLGGLVSAGTSIAGDMVLGNEVDVSGTIAGSVITAGTAGFVKLAPGVPGRLPGLGTKAFFIGAHTQRAAGEEFIQTSFQTGFQKPISSAV